jgi:hypothetical protein
VHREELGVTAQRGAVSTCLGPCSGSLNRVLVSRGILHELTAGHSAEENGLAERHNLTLLDKALPMLFDSGDTRHGLLPLSPEKHARDAIVYANDLHNALPAKGAQLGRSPYEGFWGRTVTTSVFHTFGRRVYVHVPGKPFAHHEKYVLRGMPGRFLGFAWPFEAGIYRVLLDTGREVQSQTVVFDSAPCPPPPVLQTLPQAMHNSALSVQEDDSDSEDEADKPQQLAHPQSPPQQEPIRWSGRARRVPDVFDPTPQTRLEQAAEQQAHVSAASTSPGVKRQGVIARLPKPSSESPGLVALWGPVAESEVYGFVGDTLSGCTGGQ